MIIQLLLHHTPGCCLSLDITRACLLDESQGRMFAEVLPTILKEIGRQKAKEMFPVRKISKTIRLL